MRLLLCMLACAGIAAAEEIRGIVRDPSGAGIAGAVVQLRAADQTVAETITNTRGEFTLPATATGNEIAIDAEGFAPLTQPVRVSDAADRRLSLVLEIAPYRQSVEVGGRMPVYQDQFDMSGVRESPAKDVGEALTALDGVWKIRKAGIANDLVIRGFQQNNINVLVDGSRTYAACPGHMDPAVQHVDFAEVDHVELTKGAFDVAHQGSLGALVNVVTRSPGMGFSLKPSLSLGSFGYYNPAVTGSYGRRAFQILGGYSFRTSNPYRDGSGRRFTDYANYSTAGREEQSFGIHTGWIETWFSPGENQNLSLAYTRQQAGLILYPYLTMDSGYDHADRGMLKYSIHERRHFLRNVRMEAYFTQVKHFMADDLRNSARSGAWSMAAMASSRVTGGRLETDLGRDLTFGAESYARNWTVAGYMKTGMMTMTTPTVPDVDTQTLGAFLDYRHTLTERLRISAGLRFDHASMRVTAANASTDLYYRFHNTRRTSNRDNYPSGNIRLSLALPGSTEWFAGIGTTGRIPDAEERYLSRGMGAGANAGDPLLPITRNTELNTGLNLSRGRFYFRPDLFYSYLTDYIVVNYQPSAGRSYTNVDARIYGGEAAYGAPLTRDLSLAGGTSYTLGIARRKATANVLSTNLPEMPPLRTWAALRYVREWAFAEVGGTGVARQSRVDTDLNETATPGYALMNLKLGVTRGKVSASFSVDNLLDRFYYEHLSYYRDPFGAGIKVPEPGRNFFAQLRYAF